AQLTIIGGDKLGFAAGQQGSDGSGGQPDLKVSLRDGSVLMINLHGAITIGDVLNRLNQAKPGKFGAAINADKTGLDLTDSSIPVKENGADKSTFTVEAAQDAQGAISLAGDGLGILGRGEPPTANQPDLQPNVVHGSPLQQGSIVDHFFVQATPS